MRRALQLAYPRRADAQHLADLLQVELLDIIELHHQRLAFGQGGDGGDQAVALLAIGQLRRTRWGPSSANQGRSSA